MKTLGLLCKSEGQPPLCFELTAAQACIQLQHMHIAVSEASFACMRALGAAGGRVYFPGFVPC